ncbi:MAG: hypothetical protein Q4A42_03685 [Tissierellia bacterium]|nr:hypothetical protein [Tissierellia bacterium]
MLVFISEKERLLMFLELRNLYIDQLEAGKITKKEFNHKNFMIFRKLSLKPFSVLDSFEKAMYNYNYYNSQAKIELEEYNKAKDFNNQKRAKFHLNNKENYYNLKDIATEAIIELEGFDNIESYFIKLHSKNLGTNIFEINIKNRKRAIFHSKSYKILNLLKNNNVFINEVRDSIIDSYVNNS